MLLSLVIGQAQNRVILGKLVKIDNTPVPQTEIWLLKATDSSRIQKAISNNQGDFYFQLADSSKYFIDIKCMEYKPLRIVTATVKDTTQLGELILEEATTTIDEFTIVYKIPPVVIKGDTIQYNADAFKTNPDATAEDLLQKMPGFTNNNGKTQAQGEDVQQVLVNGKPLFGDDPNAALKNLPADVIDKIEVFDKKSDQAQFTGFDDGNTTKTINIVTKTKIENGTFGKLYAGYGTDNRWKAGLSYNYFKDNRKISIITQTNNVNEQNFSSEDLVGVMNSGSGGSDRGGRRGGSGRRGGDRGSTYNSTDNFLVDQKGGNTVTNAFGINYVDKWKKVEFSSSYFLNYTNNESVSDLYRQYFSSSLNLNYIEENTSSEKNLNHRLNAKLEWKIDSSNTLIIQPKFSLQQNSGSSQLSTTNNELLTLLSQSLNTNTSDLRGTSASTALTYRHNFKKSRRTISWNLIPSYSNTLGDGFLDAYTNDYTDTMPDDTLNQFNTTLKNGYSVRSNITYTEPIGMRDQLMFSLINSHNYNYSSKETFQKDDNENYSNYDSSLSNSFNSIYGTHAFGTSYRHQTRIWNLTLGLTAQMALLNNEQTQPLELNTQKTFYSLLPNSMFQYKFTPKKNIRINYRSSNNVPSVNQLQNVVNNTNPLQISMGNPELKQDWKNYLSIRYSSVNAEKQSSFFVLVNGSHVNHYISNSTFIANQDSMIAENIVLSRGSQLSKPVNLNGYYNLNTFISYGVPVSKLKSNFNLSINAGYTTTPGIVNSILNKAQTLSSGVGLVLSSNISEKVDFTLSSNTGYNHVTNTLDANSNSSYINQYSRLKIQVMPWKGLVLQADVNHQYYNGLADALTQQFTLLNAGIGYKFLKNKTAEIRLIAFDILKQNNSLVRNTTETYYEDVQTNVLQQYYMMVFTWNFKQFKKTAPSNSEETQK